jgi:hypothetical protein
MRPQIVGNENTETSCSFKSILVITAKFTQKAALHFKINVNGNSTQQILQSAKLK